MYGNNPGSNPQGTTPFVLAPEQRFVQKDLLLTINEFNDLIARFNEHYFQLPPFISEYLKSMTRFHPGIIKGEKILR